MDELRQLIREERTDDAWRRLLRLAATTDDPNTYLQLVRSWKRLRQAATPRANGKTVRIALLGGATTDFLADPLALALDALGIATVMHRADFNTLAHEMLDPASATATFKPDVAVVAPVAANIPAWPAPGDDLERVRQLAREGRDHWLGLCTRLHEHTGCEIVLDNFHDLPYRPLGNLSATLPWEPSNFLRRLNLELGDAAPAYLHVHDVAALAAQHGVRRWFDPRYWHHAKQPVSFDCLLPYVRSTARIIGALYGRSAKCLVLDLDNTLWGGVVGDDGPDGIRVGPGDPVGEAFSAFQEYVLRLKERGVLLAVCSKNDERNALAAFEQRREMPLRREDFVAFRANWEPKPDNLVSIARELDIGIDSLVFVDDNPAEREHVRQRLPEVRVLELTDDPADYPALLDDAGYFEPVALSAEDRIRTEQYRANAERARTLESAGDYDAYLASLEQQAVLAPLEERSLDRITQLINKSNQFNLTTVRMTRSQVEELMRSPEHITLTVSLRDRFGDNGLISVIIARRDGAAAFHVDLWLMSCRVLKRGVERLVCNALVERMRAAGARELRGTYLPTAKNALVRDHYATLGFERIHAGDDGATDWRLALDTFQPFTVPITVLEDVRDESGVDLVHAAPDL